MDTKIIDQRLQCLFAKLTAAQEIIESALADLESLGKEFKP